MDSHLAPYLNQQFYLHLFQGRESSVAVEASITSNKCWGSAERLSVESILQWCVFIRGKMYVTAHVLSYTCVISFFKTLLSSIFSLQPNLMASH